MKKTVTFAAIAGAALTLAACGAKDEAAPADEAMAEETPATDEVDETGNPVGGNPVGPDTPDAPAEGDAMAGEAAPAE